VINPSATLYSFLAAQTGVTALVDTRLWAERRVPMPGYKPASDGAALVFWQMPGRLDYSSKHLAVPVAFKCCAANDVDAYTLYGALVDALQDAHYAPMYEATMALAGQTMREPPDITDWCYVQTSFMCHFRMS